MSETIADLQHWLAKFTLPRHNLSLIESVQREIVRHEVQRLIARLRELESGMLVLPSLKEGIEICQAFTSLCDGDTTFDIALVHDRVTRLPLSVRSDIDETIQVLQYGSTISPENVFRVLCGSLVALSQDKPLLRLIVGIACQEGRVIICPTPSRAMSTRFLQIKVESTAHGHALICVGESEDIRAVTWRLYLVDSERADFVDLFGQLPAKELHSVYVTPQSRAACEDMRPVPDRELSVADLFGNNIVLRDLQPRRPDVRGLLQIRERLEISKGYIPRKNEPVFARVVSSFIEDITTRCASDVIYVGDTLFNDGSVIENLSSLGTLHVFGFLCNEKGFGCDRDFVLGPTYFATRWRALVNFFDIAHRRGLSLGPTTIGIFDLDQTVYAAKGRDDAPLYRARWRAIQSFLAETVPLYKSNDVLAQAMYREFDQDDYHRLTRDNMDYIVILVLAIIAGLCDAKEIQQFLESQESTIVSLTAQLLQRAEHRVGHEDINRVLGVIRATHYNTLMGDQTPCREFRKHECLFMKEAMRGAAGDRADSTEKRILINREVADFVHFLRERGCAVLALSDRPVEAAVLEEDDGENVDLMQLPMAVRGHGILDLFRANYA